jgi:glycosyltransferase 2 family protein
MSDKKSNLGYNLIKFLLFLGVGLGILYFVYQNQETAFQRECACKGGCEYNNLLAKIWADFAAANFWYLGLVSVAFILSVLSRALRWNILIEPLGYKVKAFNSFFVLMIGYLINLALPRAGELAKPALLHQYEKVPMDKLMGTIVVDRIFDVIMLLLVLGFSFFVQFDSIMSFVSGENRPVAECVTPQVAAKDGLPWFWIFVSFLSMMVLAGLIVLIKWNAIKQTALYAKVKQLVVNFWAGMLTVFQLKRPFMFLFHTVFIWLMYFVMTYVCFWAYLPTAELGISAALLAFVFGAFGVLIPSPGGMGTYQLAVTAALVIYGVNNADAFAFANILFFTINVFCNIFFGLLAYMVLPIYNRNYQPELPNELKNS